MRVNVAQSCPTLCDPVDYIVHGILQARTLEWVAFPFSRGICLQCGRPGSNPWVGKILNPPCRHILYQLIHKGSPKMLEGVAFPFSGGST